MPEAQTFERTAPYLRGNQIESMKREADRQRTMLEAPPYIASSVDKNLARKTLQALSRQLENDAPKAYEGADRDKAKAREEELRAEWLQGMPTAAEMRKAPPGALEKHMAWERRNAKKIDEWKNIRQRQFVSGMLPSDIEGSAISNIELYRPQGGPQELSMDNAQIPGKQFHFGANFTGPGITFTDREVVLMDALAPGLREKLAILTNAQREEVKGAVAALSADEPWNVEGLDHAELRKRCKAAGLKADGTVEVLQAKLREFYGVEKPPETGTA